MPLLDHFREPVTRHLQWNSFHHAWAAVIAFDLNARLPKEFYARPHAVFGVEIDVAALHDGQPTDPAAGWAPAATLTAPFAVGADQVGVLVHTRDEGILAGAVELVSPRNKDRPTAREAFVGKCVSYLTLGAGVVVVDVVTNRHGNLHRELWGRIQPGVEAGLSDDLYAVAYHPTGTDADGRVEAWPAPLAVGGPLPVLPLWLLNGPCVRLDLDGLYQQTLCGLGVSRNGTNGAAH